MDVKSFINQIKTGGWDFFAGTQNYLFSACLPHFEDNDYCITVGNENEAINLCKGVIFNNKKPALFLTETEFIYLKEQLNGLESLDDFLFVVFEKSVFKRTVKKIVEFKNIVFVDKNKEIFDLSDVKIFKEKGLTLGFKTETENDLNKEEIMECVCEAVKEKNFKLFSSIANISKINEFKTNINFNSYPENTSVCSIALGDYLTDDERKIRIVFDDCKTLSKNLENLASVGHKNPNNYIYFLFNNKKLTPEDREDYDYFKLVVGAGLGIIDAMSLQDVKNVINSAIEEFENGEDNNAFCVFVNY